MPDLLPNSISIDPYLIKFDNNNLIVEAFVINGFEHNVYNIDIKEFTIANEDDEVIASASDFGLLQDVTIAPLSYIRWTFVFSDNAIYKVDDDFNKIKYSSSVYNKY